MLGRDVLGAIPNNYRLVQSAALSGAFVGTETDLGKAYAALARAVLGEAAAEPTVRKRFALSSLLG
jgi:hypothetical protein